MDAEELRMKIILKQDVDDLGFEGDTVKVADGFARNYLIPRGYAVVATPRNVKAFESQRKKIEVRRLKAKDDAEKLREKLEGTSLTFSQKAGEEGKLYGSVTSMDIAAQLEKHGVVIDRRKVLLESPIKVLGEYDVGIRIYPRVTATIRVTVVPEGEVGN
jgi:large subunit ribosomal protein L9